MTKLPLIALGAALALSGCNNNKKAEREAAADAANAANAAAEAAVVADMPPPIKAQKLYRCKDNSIVSIDFFEGDTQANVHDGGKDAPPTMLKAAAAGEPLTAEGGWSLTGSGASVTLERPGKGSQSCKG